MSIDHNNGFAVQRRDGKRTPPNFWWNWLIGRPLQTADAPHQTIGKVIGLAVFASDALSSTAYATQEMLVILALGGAAALHLSFPLSIAIVLLLGIVILSYEQTVHAYPNGAGSYIVSRDNLGALPSLIAAAALLIDYVLTVAVSISSSVAQLTSAFEGLFPFRVEIAIGLVIFIMTINLRGVKESGRAFALPTYFFIAMMYIMLAVGFYRYFTHNLGVVVDPPELELIGPMQPIGFFLILRAFSNGTSALTGVEAISDGITAFREPRSKNAGMTLIWLSVILGTLMLGITFLAWKTGVVPSEAETVVSQIGRTIFRDRSIAYFLLMSATTVILVMAANTAFADFPRLGAFVAADGYLPRQLTFRGSRLVYSRGIAALAILASILIVIFQASVTRLIPLYAIGVFMSFTLSQSGMAYRWWKSGKLKPGEEIVEKASVVRHDPKWKLKIAINSFGALATFVVMIVFIVTKFVDGAWIVILLIPLLVVVFWSIHRHYKRLAKDLSLEECGTPLYIRRHRVILPIGGVHRGTLAALRYARQLSDDITAVHVSIDPDETEKIQKKWETWGEGVRLVILDSPYRILIEPLIRYIDEIDHDRKPDEVISIVVPQFVPRRFWTNFMHARNADTLRNILINRENIVITEVPYVVD
ncbi:MAG: APC family permease [Anaerolineae bacterium]|jgi:amino acid transporter|nr:APC family permease [Anaerolineae bacterium]